MAAKKKSQAMNPQAMAAILRDPEGELLREILKLQEEADQEYRQLKALVEKVDQKADKVAVSRHTIEDLKKRNIDPATTGIKYEVVSDEEAEEAPCVVCSQRSEYPDAVHTVCAACFKPIVHRPHVPKRPAKLCIACASSLSEEQILALRGQQLPFHAPRFGGKPTIN